MPLIRFRQCKLCSSEISRILIIVLELIPYLHDLLEGTNLSLCPRRKVAKVLVVHNHSVEVQLKVAIVQLVHIMLQRLKLLCKD